MDLQYKIMKALQRKGRKMREQMKNQNEYREDGKLCIKELKYCECTEKRGNKYLLYCHVIQRGYNFYYYDEENNCLTRDTDEKKHLYLGDTAKETVKKNIEIFEKFITEMKNGGYKKLKLDEIGITICYKHLFKYIYSFITISKNSENEIVYTVEPSCNVEGMVKKLSDILMFKNNCKSHIRDVLYNTNADNIAENPLYMLAEKFNDDSFKRKIRLYYRIASTEDCRLISQEYRTRMLPPLKEDFNKDYIVHADGVNAKLLFSSGYRILHRPYFAMKGSTHSLITLNPHTKIGVDAAKVSSEPEAITFEDYMKLFDDRGNNA